MLADDLTRGENVNDEKKGAEHQALGHALTGAGEELESVMVTVSC